MKKKICYISSSRADYGIVSNLLKELSISKDFKLSVIATGAHLSKKYGNSIEEILSDGLKIDKKIKLDVEKDSDIDIAKCMGQAIPKFTKIYKEIKPDFILLLGDRYEILSAAIASQISNIPILHLHGGELTEGAFDDAFRHSITKMSHAHFTCHDSYSKRIIQMGENPKRVFNVGSLGVHKIMNKKFLSKKDLELKLKFKFKDKNILFTFHPETLNKKTHLDFKLILRSLSEFKDINFLITEPNHDPKNNFLRKELSLFAKKNSNFHIFKNLGQEIYFSCLNYVDCVVGNSSSGIIEVPSFGIPTINLGERQGGRYKTDSIISCVINHNHIVKAIKKVYSKNNKQNGVKINNPFYKKNTPENIIKIIYKMKVPKSLKKNFFDF